MKAHHVSLVVAAMLACTAFAAESPSAKGSGKEAPKAAVPAANQATVELTVTGMTWPVGCANKVRSALTKVPGVIKAEVKMPNSATVQVEKGKVTAKQLVEAVKKAGYGASEKTEKEKEKGQQPNTKKPA